MTPNLELEPIWITGMFRSGTSITAKIMGEMGVDLGPENHLLIANGTRKALNPDGFYENYLLMDWSLHMFHEMGAWGDQPPTLNQVEAIINKELSENSFVRDSIINIHDDRISNWNKMRVLSKYGPNHLDTYLSDCFSKPLAVKNPHFMLLSPWLDCYFPHAKYLVVFRNPVDTIRSAKQVTLKASFQLYLDYYERILNHPNAVFFDFDRLIQNPEASISALADEIKYTGNIMDTVKLVRQKTDSTSIENVPIEVTDIYKQLQQKAINKNG